MFVVIEGIDSVGKTVQADLLTKRVERGGQQVASFSFPRYETVLGEAIRRHLKREIVVAQNILWRTTILGLQHTRDGAEERRPDPAPEDAMIFQCMMVVDKYQAAPEIDDHLRAGDFVIANRYWQSALAYGVADGVSREWLLRVHTRLPQADLNILIDLKPEEALRRRPEARDRYEKDRDKQAHVRGNYLDLWHMSAVRGLERYVIIDGAGTENEVHERIWDKVVKRATR